MPPMTNMYSVNASIACSTRVISFSSHLHLRMSRFQLFYFLFSFSFLYLSSSTWGEIQTSHRTEESKSSETSLSLDVFKLNSLHPESFLTSVDGKTIQPTQHSPRDIDSLTNSASDNPTTPLVMLSRNRDLLSNETLCGPSTFPHPVHENVCLLPVGPPSSCPRNAALKDNLCRFLEFFPGIPVCPENTTFIRPSTCFLGNEDIPCSNTSASHSKLPLEKTNSLCGYTAQDLLVPYCPNGYLSSDNKQCIEEFSPSVTACPQGYTLESIDKCVRETYVDPIDECDGSYMLTKGNTCYNLLEKNVCGSGAVYNVLSEECVVWKKKIYSDCPEDYQIHPLNESLCYKMEKQPLQNLTTHVSLSELKCEEPYQESQDKTLCVAPSTQHQCPDNSVYSPKNQFQPPCLFKGTYNDTCPPDYFMKNGFCMKEIRFKPLCPDGMNCYREMEITRFCPETANEIIKDNQLFCYQKCDGMESSTNCDPQIEVPSIPSCPKAFKFDSEHTCYRADDHVCPNATFETETKMCIKHITLTASLECKANTLRSQILLGQHRCTHSYRANVIPLCLPNATYNEELKRCELSKEILSKHQLPQCPEGWNLSQTSSACIKLSMIERSSYCPKNYTSLVTPLPVSLLVSTFLSSNMTQHLFDLFSLTPLPLLSASNHISDWCEKKQPLVNPMPCNTTCRRCPKDSVLSSNKCIMKQVADAIYSCSNPLTAFNKETKTCVKMSPPSQYKRRGVLIKPTYRCPEGSVFYDTACVGYSLNFTYPTCSSSQERFVNQEQKVYCYARVLPNT